MSIFLNSAAIIFLILTIAFLVVNPEKKVLDAATRQGIGRSFVELPDGVVHFETGGKTDGKIVVLVHGFSTPGHIWDPTFQALSDAGFRVIRYDLYGRGYSDRPKVKYDLELFVRQLKNLLKALKINKPIHLVGLSMGGPITAAFCTQNPECIKSLTLIDPLVTNIFKSRIFPLNIPWLGEYIMTVIIAPFILPKTQSGDFIHPENFPDWEEKYRNQLQYKGFSRAILSTMRNFSRIDAIQQYQTIGQCQFPVLMIWGKEDQTISREDMQILENLIPNHQFFAIDQAGHIPHYERADVVNPILINFFKNTTSNN